MLCFILFFVFLFYSSCYFRIFRIFYRIFIVVSSFYFYFYYYFNFIYHVLFLYFIYCIFFTAFIGLKAHFWLKTWTQNDPGPGPQQQAKQPGQRRPRSADSPSDPASFPRGPRANRPPAGLLLSPRERDPRRTNQLLLLPCLHEMHQVAALSLPARPGPRPAVSCFAHGPQAKLLRWPFLSFSLQRTHLLVSFFPCWPIPPVRCSPHGPQACFSCWSLFSHDVGPGLLLFFPSRAMWSPGWPTLPHPSLLLTSFAPSPCIEPCPAT